MITPEQFRRRGLIMAMFCPIGMLIAIGVALTEYEPNWPVAFALGGIIMVFWLLAALLVAMRGAKAPSDLRWFAVIMGLIAAIVR